ncbi:MAG: hypothetical protein ACP5U2_01015 [Bryobacteraceae bacterium]
MVESALVLLVLSLWSWATTAWVARRGWVLYFGDAEAHLNIARRIVDSRTPGYEQIGTVWLPLPHLAMLPLARRDEWWRSGLAGAAPASAAFVIAGCLFYAALVRAFQSRPAALAGLGALALNPNLLYLKSTAMSEAFWLAALGGIVYFSVRYRSSPSLLNAAGAGVVTMAGTLTRYEGWFLIPFVTLYLLATGDGRRWRAALVYGMLAAAGPLYWLAHNWWLHGDPLEFYRGPYSARAIYQRSLDQGMARYPGDHDWRQAWIQLREAARLCAGWPLAVMGTAGLLGALLRRRWWIVALAALPVAFYWLSIYCAGTPIFVPHLWPYSYYNTRYGLVALPLLAVGVAGAILLVGPKWRSLAAIAAVAACSAWWAARPRPEAWICWKESQVNSEARRAWTQKAAEALARWRRPGDGVAACFGDLAGVFRTAGIPLRYMLHEGNGPAWLGAMARPELMLAEPWALVITGDALSGALAKLPRQGPRYHLWETIVVKGGPVVQLYRRSAGYDPDTLHQGARSGQ